MTLLSTRIVDIVVHAVRIPRHYVTHVAEGGSAQGKQASAYYLLELMGDDGQVGLGEISDMEAEWDPPPPEQLRTALKEALIGQPVVDENSLKDRSESALSDIAHPELKRLTRCAVEIAILDLMGRCAGVPVSALLGGTVRRNVNVSWVAYIRSTEDVVSEVEQRQNEGFSAFKLKVGLDADQDDDRVEQVRARLNPGAHLRVDASGAWGPSEARDRLHRLGELGIDAVETPLAVVARSVAKDRPHVIDEDPESAARQLASLRSEVAVPLIEHVGDFEDPFTLALLAHRSVDAINVIPAQAGGLRRARRLLGLAEAARIPALLGSTVELGIGTAAALHVAATSPAVTWASDLVGPGLLTADVVEPAMTYVSGQLSTPPGSGLGVRLSPEALQRWQG